MAFRTCKNRMYILVYLTIFSNKTILSIFLDDAIFQPNLKSITKNLSKCSKNDIVQLDFIYNKHLVKYEQLNEFYLICACGKDSKDFLQYLNNKQ